jgi:hypothetical protein
MLRSDIRVHNEATFEAEIIATHAWPTNRGLVAFPPVRTEIGKLVNPYPDGDQNREGGAKMLEPQ